MTATSIIARLKSLKIQLSVQDDTLKLVPPAGVEIPLDLLAEVKAMKQEIITWMNKLKPATRIERADLGEYFPLSENQMALWPTVGSRDGMSAYNMPVAYLLQGMFSLAILQKALNTVVQQHDSLRTVFFMNGELPVQTVYHSSRINSTIEVHHCSDFTEEQIRQLLIQLAEEPFDLFHGPLFRVTILHLSEDRNIYFLNMHHLISDGWSLGIFTKELLERYNAFVSGEENPVAAAGVRYGDFVLWQQSMLDSPDGVKQRNYWQKRISNASPLLPLPYDVVPSGIKSYTGSMERGTLPAENFAGFRSLCIKTEVSTFIGLFAAVNALLYRYTGEEQLVLGIPAASRVHTDLDGVIGLFANTLPISTTIHENISFRKFLGSVKQDITEAYDHQFYPLHHLQEHSGVNGPLFNVLVVYRQENDFYEHLPAIHGLEITTYPLPVTTSKFDLSFVFVEKQDTLEFGVEYNNQVFCRETIVKMLQHFQCLLNGLAANPETDITSANFLEASEQHRLLHVLNPKITPAPDPSCIGVMIDKQADTTPDQIALSSGDDSITYSELSMRSALLAAHLITNGLQSGELVGIFAARSINMVIGMLGVLKAGGAYVPLDTEYPEERNMYYLQDSQARFLLTEQMFSEELGAYTGKKIILDDILESLAWDTDITVIPEISIHQPAYIIYTSGSSGKPKGVRIRHENVFNLLSWARKTFDTGHREVMLASTSICFDLSVFEIFFPLTCGHQVVIVKNALSLLAPSDKQLDVTIINTVPSAIRHLLEEGAIPPTVRTVNLAGEELKAELVQKIYEKCPQVQHVFNLYGPSETCTYSTSLKTDRHTRKVNIGFPISNTHIYILDKDRNLLPEGTLGEIYIGGAGVADGYHNRPDITLERFSDNPFGVDGKIYKTGDVGRWTKDGSLEYKGRLDEQVKIRGIRIECGEIENVIQQYDGITGVVVLGYDNGDGRSLATCYVANDHIAVSELRAFLQEKLPAFMVPTIFQQLDALPLNKNGKIDKKRLQAGLEEQEKSRIRIVPRNPLDQQLLELWEYLISGTPIGITDNLFVSGGTSITITRLLSRVNRKFNLDLTLVTIWQYPTIQELSDHIASGIGSALPQMMRTDKADSYLMSPGQKRIWMQCELEGSNIFNVTNVFLIRGNLDVNRLAQAWEKLAEIYEVLRTTVDMIDGNTVQIVHAPDVWKTAFAYTDLRAVENSSATCDELFRTAAVKHFDLKYGPLSSLQVCQLEDNMFRVCLVIHHVITDGWSIQLLFRSLITLYEGDTIVTPTYHYRDFSDWYQRLLTGNHLSSAIAYWRNKLPDEIPVLNLPVQVQRLPNALPAGRTAQFRLDNSLITAWDNYLHHSKATRFAGLLSIVALLLHRYCDAEQMILGTVHAGRPLQEMEDLPGMFVNTLPLVLEVDAQKDFDSLLQETIQTIMEAFAYQLAPIDTIVEEKYGSRRNEHPLFNVSVILQNYTDIVELPAIQQLEVMEELHDVDRSEHDLSFIFQEVGDGLIMNIEYRTELFTSDRIDRMHVHLEKLMEAVLQRPDLAVSQLEYLPEDEKEWLINTVNETRVIHPEKTVMELLEEQVSLFPDSIAIVNEDESITYRELADRTGRLAAYLRDEVGILPGNVVAILMDRSIAAVVSMLAIMKAGAVYMPVDTSYPEGRITYMLHDAAAAVIITDKSDRINDPSFPLIIYPAVMEVLSSTTAEMIFDRISLTDIAYIMYTSGSTGKPKGIPISHLSLTDYTCSIIKYFSLNPTHAVLQQASLAFDTSVEEIYPVLCAGGKLVVSREGGADIDGLLKLIEKHGVTLLSASPLVINELNDFPERLSSVQHIISAGEELKPGYITRLKSMAIHNLYGPTESTVSATWYKVEDIATASLIGRPMYNRSILILDRHMQLTPMGVKGEIFIGGAGLAKGYLNRPELTLEKFVPHPFVEGEILYRTGDIGEWQYDGNLKFLGRVDDQVQIRGNRVELGEVEKVLAGYDNISEVFVIAKDTPDGDKYIAAYYVAPAMYDSTQLRQYLHAVLPPYMIPAVFIHMDSFPLNASGKLDRNALPTPGFQIKRRSGEAVERPRNDLEQSVMEMWVEILGIDNISITDNFFELGGNSLKVIRLFKLLSNAYPGALSISELFVYGTVQQICTILSERLNLEESDRADVFEEFEL